MELELNLVPIFLKILYRGTELNELSSSSSTDFLELELNLVPFKKELSQPCENKCHVIRNRWRLIAPLDAGEVLAVRVGQPLPLHRGARGAGEPVQPAQRLLVRHRLHHATGSRRRTHRILYEVGASSYKLWLTEAISGTELLSPNRTEIRNLSRNLG